VVAQADVQGFAQVTHQERFENNASRGVLRAGEGLGAEAAGDETGYRTGPCWPTGPDDGSLRGR
jgi:hypothetical protein